MSDSQSTSQSTSTDEQASEAQIGVGTLLRQTREKSGLSIADVARSLRISQKYLEAVEDARHEDLPGATYAIGFVRSYAEHLHLDGEEMVRRYKDEASGVNHRSDLTFPKPISEGGVPGGAVLGLGVVIAAIAYAGWYWHSSQSDVEVSRVEPVPEHMVDTNVKAEEPASEADNETQSDNDIEEAVAKLEKVVEEAAQNAEESAEVEPVVEEAVEAPQVEEAVEAIAEEAAETVEQLTGDAQTRVDETVEDVVEATPAEDGEATAEQIAGAREEAAEPEEVTPEEATEETAEPNAEADTAQVDEVEITSVTPTERENVGPSRITLRGKSNSWISVRDEVSDRLLFMRLLGKGEEYEVPNRSGLQLMTGNAGALEVWVDGKLLPAIGRIGEVKRNVELDADKLKEANATEQ